MSDKIPQKPAIVLYIANNIIILHANGQVNGQVSPTLKNRDAKSILSSIREAVEY